MGQIHAGVENTPLGAFPAHSATEELLGSHIDVLTGLSNRYECCSALAGMLEMAIAASGTAHMLLIDFDDFRVVNNFYGHSLGDAVLLDMAAFLCALFPLPNQVYRFGGDEFSILIGHEQTQPLVGLLEALQLRAQQPWRMQGTEVHCTVSLGVVAFPYPSVRGQGDSVHSILRHADLALHEAKQRGKNRFELYEPQLDFGARHQASLEALLRKNIANNFQGFCVYYQPVFNARTNCLEGAEARLRLLDDDLILLAEDFMPLAEALGLSSAIGTFFLQEAAAACRGINNSGLPRFYVIVALSPSTLYSAGFSALLGKTLRDTGVEPYNIILSVPEYDMDERASWLFLTAKQNNMRIALDIENSSFLRIWDLKADIIRICPPRAEIIKNAFTREYFNLFVQQCHAMQRCVCVRMVETNEQNKFFRACDADCLLGDYLEGVLDNEALQQLAGKQ